MKSGNPKNKFSEGVMEIGNQSLSQVSDVITDPLNNLPSAQKIREIKLDSNSIHNRAMGPADVKIKQPYLTSINRIA
jgi:hypothetical protein